MTGWGVLQAAMDKAVQEGVFPGGVLAVRLNGEVTTLLAAGRLSADLADPVQVSTMYDLASLTKPLATVTSVLLLVQSGTLHLDRHVGQVLVELEGTPIGSAQVRDLLTHSSGLPGWRPLYERLDANGVAWGRSESAQQAILDLIAEEPLIYERGERNVYSDLGFILLGFAVERTSGMPLDAFFYQVVTRPLHAQPLCFNPLTALSPHDTAAAGVSHIAPTEWDEWRRRLLQGEVHDENAAALGGVAGHAGLFGTAEAVLAVSDAWLSSYHNQGSILDQRLVREFTRKQSKPPQSSWALGWDTPTAPSSSGTRFSPASFGHLGYTGTSLWIDPERRLEVLLLTNRVHPTRRNEAIKAFRPMIHDLVCRELMQNG